MESPRVLFVCSEIHPYLSESVMSKTGQQLPPAVQDNGFEIRTFMPRFGQVNERRNQLHEVIRLSGLNLIINDADHPLMIKVASISASRMQIYFIDNDDYFMRKDMYRNEDLSWYSDNDERAIFFARGVLETVRKLRWSPDIVHCHGWFSFVLALYLRRVFKDDPLYTSSKIILTLYDEPMPETFDEDFKKKAVCDGVRFKDLDQMNEPTFENFLKLCISYADGFTAGTENIDEKYMDYALENGKNILRYNPEEDYVEKYVTFYESLLSRRKRKLWKQ